MKTTVKTFAAAAFALAIAFAAPSAHAQEVPLWKHNIGEQLVILLDTPDAAAQADAILLTLDIARKYPDANLGAAITPLLKVARYDDAEQMRIMAVAALDAIRTDFSTEALAQIATNDSSERVQRIAKAAVLNARAGR
jgi:hypothetical protein